MPEKRDKKDLMLMKLFALGSTQDLPAMRDHVQELISLLGNSRATAKDLTTAILKDYGLTTKILQVVNSAYYMRSVPVTTISRAVTVIGYTALRDLAVAIALFEEFIKTGKETDAIVEQMTKNFISAIQSRRLAKEKKYLLAPEEAFICTLLHQLGKMVVLVYLPELYRAVARQIDKGFSEDRAAEQVLAGMTFNQVGREIASYWNFSDQLVECMVADPPKPEGTRDKLGMLQNLAAFNNKLTETLYSGTDLDLDELLYRYGGILGIDKEEAVELVHRSVAEAEDMSDPIRRGLYKLKVREKLITVQKGPDATWRRIT